MKKIIIIYILNICFFTLEAQVNQSFQEIKKYLNENNTEYSEGIADDGKHYIMYLDSFRNNKYMKGCYFEEDICFQWVFFLPISCINDIIKSMNENFVKLKYHLTWKDYKTNLLYRIDNESDRNIEGSFVFICTVDKNKE